MLPKFFATQLDFRKWLAQNHESENELVVGFYKVGSGRPSMTWPESVDQALCYGWIDGVRRRIDEESYSVRFTPRKSNSIWSAVNIEKIDKLSKGGFMQPAGLSAFAARIESNSRIYAYETPPAKLSHDFEAHFRANDAAWKFFTAQPPSYKRVMIHHIMSAKQEKTRRSRLENTIAVSANRKRVT